jgi:monolysocardiolipin acyltransferase
MAIAGVTGALCRGFVYGLNNVEVTGLNNLLNILDRRRTQGADRGLLTVSNHVMVYVHIVLYLTRLILMKTQS